MLTVRLNSRIARNGVKLLKSRFATNKSTDDDKLVYFGLFDRIRASRKLLEPNGKLQLNKIKAGLNVIDGLLFKNERAWKVFIDLQHPLLEKYIFDWETFVSGAKDAGECFLNAFISPVLYNHLSGVKSDKFEIIPEPLEIIQSTSSPNLQNVIKSTFQSIYEQKLPITVTGIRIKDASLIGVKTSVYYDTKTHSQNMILYYRKNITTSGLINFLSYPNKDMSGIEKVDIEPHITAKEGRDMATAKVGRDDFNRKLNFVDQINYPNGSVQVSVSVVFNTEVKYTDENDTPVAGDTISPLVVAFGRLKPATANATVSEAGQAVPTTGTADENAAPATIRAETMGCVSGVHVPLNDETNKETINKTSNGTVSNSIEKTRNENLKFIFSACISNQEELEWKVIHFEPYHGEDEELVGIAMTAMLCFIAFPIGFFLPTLWLL